jgi:hypothetical protein
VKWLDRLLGRDATNGKERAEDERALRELRHSFKRVGNRTDRLIDAYARADAQRKRRDAAP